MNRSMRWIAGLIVGSGILLIGWGPSIFASLTGTRLPLAVATSANAMNVWAAMGLLRLVGAALVIIGAVGWALGGPKANPRTACRALFFSALLGFGVAAVEALAVWREAFGVMLAVPFAFAILLGWWGGVSRGREVHGAV